MCLGASLADIILPLNLGLILYHLEITPACDLNAVKTIFNPAPVLSDNFKSVCNCVAVFIPTACYRDLNKTCHPCSG